MWSVSTADVKVIIDPFSDIGYPMPKELSADVVIASHEHADHNNFKLIVPPFKKVSQVGTYHIKGIKIRLIEVSHGKLNGKKLGDTFLSIIYIDDMTLLHCGDIGEIPNQEVIDIIKDVDLLFIPVGGQYTIDANTAKELIEMISPKVVFPMHYKTADSKIDIIDTIEPFGVLFPEMETIDSDCVEIDKKGLETGKMRVIKMGYV
jgi:L-ascorbate metabolism protein UlaG (beta-lactamase superfamily)